MVIGPYRAGERKTGSIGFFLLEGLALDTIKMSSRIVVSTRGVTV
jgi:hypothetical protein